MVKRRIKNKILRPEFEVSEILKLVGSKITQTPESPPTAWALIKCVKIKLRIIEKSI